MTDVPRCTVAIVGGGFSGTMTAVQLARHPSHKPSSVWLIDRSTPVGSGVAYRTECRRHVLNVPAGNMSAFPDQADHFVHWARRRDPVVTGGSFLPRCWYGQYLRETLWDHQERTELRLLTGSVVDLVREDRATRVMLADGRAGLADFVVLAAGNYAPAEPETLSGLSESPRFLRDPWANGAIREISPQDAVLLIGSGLTAIDMALDLHERGHRAKIHMVSRRGLLPQVHRPPGHQRPLPPPPELLQGGCTVRSLLQGFRAALRRAAERRYDWRDVLTAMRPITPMLWSRLDAKERTRFLRHLRPFWESHRHRLPPAIAEAVQEMRRTGGLTVHAARIVATQAHGDGLRVRLRPRGAGRTRTINAAWVINCTGPSADVRRLGDPLWDNLLRRGLAQADQLGLGVLASPHGAVLDARATPSDWLYLIGPLRRAHLWECTAVPELRVHAEVLARRLIAMHDQRSDRPVPRRHDIAHATGAIHD